LPGVLAVSHKVRSVAARATIDAATHTARIERVDSRRRRGKLHVTGTGVRTEQGQLFTGRAEFEGHSGRHRLVDLSPTTAGSTSRRAGAPGDRRNSTAGTLDVATEFGLSAPGNDISQLKGSSSHMWPSSTTAAMAVRLHAAHA